MSADQQKALDGILRGAPLDVGGEVVEQRALLHDLLTSQPLPEDVEMTDGKLGGLPTVEVSVGTKSTGPVIFYLHGGGYALGSAREAVGLASDLARRASARAVIVDYRLAPESPHPAALDDAVDAYVALIDGVDPTDVVIAGESAGGGLVMALLVALRDRDVALPACAVVMSPWVDLTLSGESSTARADVDPTLTVQGLRRRVADYAGEIDPATPAISPLFADLAGLPPLLVQVGSHEILLDDAVRLATRAAHADVAVELQVTPGVPHAFQGFAAILDEGALALDAAGAFIESRTAQASHPAA